MVGQIITEITKETIDKSNLSKYQGYKMDYEIAKAAQLNEFVHNLYNTAKILTVSIIQVYKHQYLDYVTSDVITLLDYFDTVINEIDDYGEEELVSIITGGEETDGEQLLEERSSGSDDDERTGTPRERGITITFPTTPITIGLPPPIFTPYDHTKQDIVAEAKAKAEQAAKEAADKRAAADKAADKANQTTRDKVNADKVAADAKRALQEEMKGITKDGKDNTNLGWIAGVINGLTGGAEIINIVGGGNVMGIADTIGTIGAIIANEGVGGLINLLGPTVAGGVVTGVGGVAITALINSDKANTDKANTKVAEEYTKAYTEAILSGKTEAEAKAEAKTAAENTIITQSSNGEITVTAKEGGVDVNSVIKEVEDALDRVGPLITEAAEAEAKAAEAAAAEKEAYEEKLEAAKEAKEAEETAAKEAKEAAAKEAEETTNPSDTTTTTDTTTYEYEDDVPICGSDETPCSADCSGDCTSECPGDCSSDCGSDCTSDCSGDCGSDEPPCGADYCATDCSSDDCSSDCGTDIGCEGDICVQE